MTCFYTLDIVTSPQDTITLTSIRIVICDVLHHYIFKDDFKATGGTITVLYFIK